MLKKIIWQIELDQFTFFAFSKVRIDNSDVDENGMTVAVANVGDRIEMLPSVSVNVDVTKLRLWFYAKICLKFENYPDSLKIWKGFGPDVIPS